MQQLGAGNRRLSYSHIIPQMPKISSMDNGIRTKYKQMNPPSIQLKDFKRKVIPFHDIFQREFSSEIKFPKTQRKYQRQTLATMISESDSKFDIKSPKQSYTVTDFKNTPQNSTIRLKQSESENNLQNNNGQSQALQGYTMGNKIQEEILQQQSEEQELEHKYKSYGQLSKPHREIRKSASQIRMDNKYLRGNQALLKNRRQDIDFLNFLNQYKVTKHKIKVQTRRKIQSQQMLAQIKKVSSLPKISNKIPKQTQNCPQIILPTYQQLYGQYEEDDLQQKARNIRKNNSLSSFRYYEQKKQNLLKRDFKEMKEQKIKDSELEQMHNITHQLRKKGLTFDQPTIRKGLLNIRTFAVDVDETQRYSQPRDLISNPLFNKKK